MRRTVYVHQIQSPSWKNLLPLSAALLTSYAKSLPEIEREYDFEIRILREAPSHTAASFVCPDVLAFSTYSWNFSQSLEVARIARLSNPESLVVFGGPMIPNCSADIDAFFRGYPFVDVLAHGMGEWVFSDILLARLGKKDWSSIAGVSYKDEHGTVVTTESCYDRDLDEIPSPFLDGTFDGIMQHYGDKITGALWETNRGCPYGCSFCVQGNHSFSKILKFSKERLYTELQWLSERNIPYVFGTDANFGLLRRDVEIAQHLANLAGKNGFPEFFIVNWLKNSSEKMMDIVEILREGGVRTRLTLSMQSFNNATLEAVRRRNIDLPTFEKLKSEAAQKGITTYTELILGLPEDTYASLLASVGRCMDSYLTHHFVVYLCRLLDGTEMAQSYYKDKYKLETRTCQVGLERHERIESGIPETEQIVVATSTLPLEDWKRAFEFIHMALLLYNFRLAFFVFNYLCAEHSIDLVDFIEYIISRTKNIERYPALTRALGVINGCSDSILNARTNLVRLNLAPKILFGPHEGALVMLLDDLPCFYGELRELTRGYLRSQKIVIGQDLLDEVFEYQAVRVPTWKKSNHCCLQFEFNVPQYFQRLCSDGARMPLRRQRTYAEIGDVQDEYNSPVDLTRARLTISTFELSEVQSIEVFDDAVRYK